MANTSIKRDIALSRDSYLYLLKIVTDNLNSVKSMADLSDYSDEELATRAWRVEQAEKANEELGIAQKIYDAVLFGTDEV